MSNYNAASLLQIAAHNDHRDDSFDLAMKAGTHNFSMIVGEHLSPYLTNE